MRRIITVVVAVLVLGVGGSASGMIVIYDQGFEVNSDGIIDSPGPVTRVASGGGTLGAPSGAGLYHAEVTLSNVYGEGFYTKNGGYSSVWPGYIRQSIKVYIDPSAGTVGDGYFWDAAINNAYGTWGRGGGFGVQKTGAGTWSLGAEDDRGGFGWVGNTAFTHSNTTPLQITVAGWYTLATEWVETADGLWINQINNVYDIGGSLLWTDTVNKVMSGPLNMDPGQQDIKIGGIRYSWLGSEGVGNTMTLLAVDDVRAEVVPEPLTMLGMFLGLGSVGAYIRRRRRA